MEENGQTVFKQTFRKEDLLETPDKEVVIQSSWLESFDPTKQSATILCGIFIPDTDLGDLVEIVFRPGEEAEIQLRE